MNARLRVFFVIIRKYKSVDCALLAQLFYDTVHTVNFKDYTKEELDVWATGNVDLDKWNNSFLEEHTLIAMCDSDLSSKIVTFQ